MAICEKNAILFCVILLSLQFIYGDETIQREKEELLYSFVNKGREVPAISWPLGIVPYYLNHSSYDYLIARRVRSVMNSLEDVSCVKFQALTAAGHNESWLHITNPGKERECVHTDHRDSNATEINLVLGYECLQHREILHSLMHAIGFKDEVTHPQRDQYVRIMWENIHPKYQPLFRIRYNDFSPITSEYDPESVMHFHDRAFTKNGHATITPLISGLIIKPSDTLSSLDKMRLQLIFGHECNKRKVGDILDTCKSVMHNNLSLKENVTVGNTGNETFEIVSSELDKNSINIDDKEEHSDNTAGNSGGELESDNNESIVETPKNVETNEDR